jgi:ankyrin repeat protein
VTRLLLELDTAEIDSKDNRGRTSLLYAAWSGHEALVRLLAEQDKVEIDLKDKDDRTPCRMR